MAQVVAGAVAGRSLAQIADAAGMSVSSVQRRLKDTEVLALIRDARAQSRQETLGRLTELRTRGLDRLAGLLDSDEPTVVLRAVALILNVSSRLDMVVDVEQRLVALEQGTPETAFGYQSQVDDDAID